MRSFPLEGQNFLRVNFFYAKLMSWEVYYEEVTWVFGYLSFTPEYIHICIGLTHGEISMPYTHT